MATLEREDANIIDAEETNWRLIVYPALVVVIVVVGVLAYYYYVQSQRQELETAARAALVKATTPEEMLKVAADFPHTDQATVAVLSAASASFDKHDYAAALADYQRISGDVAVLPELRDSATLGVASSQEASGKVNEAIATFLDVARRGAGQPLCALRLQHHRDPLRAAWRQGEREAHPDRGHALDPDSIFTKQAQYRLKEMTAAEAPPISFNLPAGAASGTPAPASAQSLAPAPAPARPATPLMPPPGERLTGRRRPP